MKTSLPTPEPMTRGVQADGVATGRAPRSPMFLGVRTTPTLGRTASVLSIGFILAALYLLFVVHYSVNVLFWDEWTVVPVIHAALHSRLTFGLLWAQHNENRIFFPSLVFAASSLVHSYNSKAIIVFDGLSFVASFAFLLSAFRQYLGRPLAPMHTLSLGLVWFSLEDTENSLWGFQLAWYMIIFFLMALVFLMAKERRHANIVLGLAVLTSVAASYSSLQGLILWPIGLIFLLWKRPLGSRKSLECGIWILLGVLTTALYFWGFNFSADATGGGSGPGFALHHPVGMMKFFFAALGNVVPAMSPDLWAHELLGALLFLIAAFVVVLSVRDRTSRVAIPLPVSLITFGVLFDVSIVFGRLGFGVADALSTCYTMANLLVLTGIVAFVWSRIRQTQGSRGRERKLNLARGIAFGLLAVFLVGQVVASTKFGLTTGRTTRESRIVAAQTLVNLDRMPSALGQQLITAYVYPTLPDLRPFLQEAEEDHISVFAPGPYSFYRAKGPPTP